MRNADSKHRDSNIINNEISFACIPASITLHVLPSSYFFFPPPPVKVSKLDKTFSFMSNYRETIEFRTTTYPKFIPMEIKISTCDIQRMRIFFLSHSNPCSSNCNISTIMVSFFFSWRNWPVWMQMEAGVSQTSVPRTASPECDERVLFLDFWGSGMRHSSRKRSRNTRRRTSHQEFALHETRFLFFFLSFFQSSKKKKRKYPGYKVAPISMHFDTMIDPRATYDRFPNVSSPPIR